MKFLAFTVFDASKAAEIAEASDKVMANLPPEVKVLGSYVCQAIPFPGVPLNSLVGVTIGEGESNEAMAAMDYPLLLAGATIHRVPILEMPVGGAGETEKQYRA